MSACFAKAMASPVGLRHRSSAERGDNPSTGMPVLGLSPRSALDLWRRPTGDAMALAKQADIFHLHGVWEPLLAVVAKAANIVGRPYVVTPHGMLDPWSLSQGRWKKKVALAFGYRQMLDRA